MNPVIQLTVERGQHLTTAEMFMNAGIVILVVFGVLLLMYILISISGKIIQAITSKKRKLSPLPQLLLQHPLPLLLFPAKSSLPEH